LRSILRVLKRELLAGIILLEFDLLDLLPGYVESFDRIVN
jgi:hypothetical protein